MMLILLTGITTVAGILPFTRYVSAHIPFPCLHTKALAEACERLSRLGVLFMCPTAFTPSALLVVACRAYRKKKHFSGVYGLSLVPDNTLFTCHARSPRRPQETSLYHC
jgi:hypothetical protein